MTTDTIPEELVKTWVVPTSSEKLNEFLKNGFIRGVVYTVYARQDRGKTNLCLELAFQSGEMGFNVAYVDGDFHGVTVFRLYNIITARYPNAKILDPRQVDPTKVYDYYKKILEKYNIDIYWEKTLEGLKKRCVNISAMNKYTVIIVDSVSLFYGEYIVTSDERNKALKQTTGDIAKIYGKLRDTAMNQNHLKILVFTTQRASLVKEALHLANLDKKKEHKIQTDESDREEVDRHMGGKAPAHYSDVIIQLTKFGKKRKAHYIKNRLFESEGTAEFEINSGGITDVGKTSS